MLSTCVASHLWETGSSSISEVVCGQGHLCLCYFIFHHKEGPETLLP